MSRLCGRDAGQVVLARSASAAFLGVLLALDLEPDAEVLAPVSICQTMINAVLLAGAIPVLADCGRDFALDAAAAAERLTRRTRVVLFHHPFGRACDLAGVRSLRTGGGPVLLVEDCAQAPGAEFEGDPVGLLGDVALLSFGVGKPLDAGVGGAAVTALEPLRSWIEAALRVGRRGWRDDILGVESTLTPVEQIRLGRAVQAYPQVMARRIAKVRRAVGVNLQGPPTDVFHRLCVDLGAAADLALDRRLLALDPRLWQTAAVETPPYAASFLQARYRARGRSDLCDPSGQAFPVWREQARRCVLLRTDPSVTAGQLSVACRALGVDR